VPLDGLLFLLAVAVGLLLGLIFRGPLMRIWNRISGEFEREQELQRLAATSEHGHFYLTIAKYDRETPPIECIEEDDGTLVFAWGGNEFSSEEAANHARYASVLAASRAYYGDIDVWTRSLPPPPPPRRRRRRG